MKRKSAGFTLVELLVVIAVIGILTAMLMPALKMAKDKAKITLCLGNQKQMGLALTNYAGDYTEYPTNYENTTTEYAGNWGDECCGKWMGGSPSGGTSGGYYPNVTDADPNAAGTQSGAWHRLAADGYVPHDKSYNPTGINNCTADLEKGWSFIGAANSIQYGLYVYNGPHAFNTGNNGSLTGMLYMGRHKSSTGGTISYGVRYDGKIPNTCRWNWSQIAFLGCPTVYKNPVMKEPHGFQSYGTYCQYDAGFTSSYPLDNYHYDRNYLFGDLHGEYIHAASRVGFPQQ